MSVTTERFDVDPAIIYPVIQSQAGTLAKAVLECVTNSYDADATSIAIEIDQNRARVTDDGHGIQTTEEVHSFFKKFGTPHQPGDSRVGRFRIGRGQAFVFGVTTWLTGPFRLVVDLREKGLDYERTTFSEPHQGCDISIDLYESLSMSEYTSIVRELEEMVHYMPVPVTLNGKQVNVLPQSKKWDHENEHYWLSVNRNASVVKFYNQGHAVCSEYLGIGGTVVTKPGVALDTNMSRNQIHHTDPIYKEIKTYFSKLVREQSTNTVSRMDDNLRAKLFGQILAGDVLLPPQSVFGSAALPDGFSSEREWFDFCEELEGRSLLVSSSGKGLSVKRLQNAACWSIAPQANTMISDKLEQTGVIVIHPKVLGWLNLGADAEYLQDDECDAQFQSEIANKFASSLFRDSRVSARLVGHFVPFSVLAENYDERNETIPKKDLKRLEVAQLHVINRLSQALSVGLSRLSRQGFIGEEFKGNQVREVYAGRSDSLQAWTDGSSYICVERSELKKLNKGLAGVEALSHLLLHEYCHKVNTSTGHQHDYEFYQTFHDALMSDELAGLSGDLLSYYAKVLDQRGLKIPAAIASGIDRSQSLEALVMDEANEDDAEKQAG